MGINASVYSRPAKFSTIIADADLDIGARAILTTDLSLYQGLPDYWYFRNRAKAVNKKGIGDSFVAYTMIKSDILSERLADAGVTVDGLLIKDDKIHEMDGIGGEVMPKIVSDNLRNSHDAEDTETTTGAAYTKVKTMSFTNGVKGTLRIKFEFHSNNASYVVYAALYKNGVLLGTPDSNNSTTYPAATSEDVAIGTVAAGETLELWVKAEHASATCTYKNFRLYYDDDSGTAVMVTS